MLKRTLLGIAALSMVGLAAGFGPNESGVKVDPRLPKYEVVQGVSGSIKSVGSDTMNNMMALWAEGFQKMYPNVRVEIEGKGSSTAPPALIGGQSSFGPMSRRMKDSEIDAFEEAKGYKPTYVRTAVDMLAVYVHKDNPIAKQGLSMEQVDAIFSKTRKGGMEDIATWGDLGLEGEWANKPISLYGRNAASGTYGYFKKNALFGGDFKDTVKEQPGSSAVVQGIARDKFGIGYSGIGYKTADVALVSLSRPGESGKVEPSAETAGQYPLSRYLYLYLDYKPGYELDTLRAEFLRYIFSRQGQEAVIKDGYLPVAAPIAKSDLKKVGLELKAD
jgi:phosphate transport system substrate-binding protein